MVHVIRRSWKLYRCSQESQPDVICSPLPTFIAQDRPKALRHFVEKLAVLLLRYALGERHREGFQPSSHAGGQWRWSGNQRDEFDAEAGALEPLTIFVSGREKPGDQ